MIFRKEKKLFGVYSSQTVNRSFFRKEKKRGGGKKRERERGKKKEEKKKKKRLDHVTAASRR